MTTDLRRPVGPGLKRSRAVIAIAALAVVGLALLVGFGFGGHSSKSTAGQTPSGLIDLGSATAVTQAPDNSFATAATTGVPAGTTLRDSGPLRVAQAGTVIDGLNVSGIIEVAASNVIIRNSRVTASAYWVIQVDSGVTGTIIENVELDGLGAGGLSGSGGVNGPVTVRNCNIHGVENGIVPSSGSVLQGNYIHDLTAPGSPHIDGIQMDGGLSNITISGNTVEVGGPGQTSAVMIDNDFGPVANIVVDHNRLIGGAYTVYSDGHFTSSPITNVTFSNNRLGRGVYGYTAFTRNTPLFSTNVDDRTGAPVAAQ